MNQSIRERGEKLSLGIIILIHAQLRLQLNTIPVCRERWPETERAIYSHALSSVHARLQPAALTCLSRMFPLFSSG